MKVPNNLVLCWSLKFIDDKTEQKYQNSKQKHQLRYIDYFTLKTSLLSLGMYLINPTSNENQFSIWRIILMALNILIILVVSRVICRKYPNQSERILAFLILFLTLTNIESSIPNLHLWNKTMFFVSGIIYHSILSSLHFGRVNWRLSLPVVIYYFLHLSLRFSDIPDSKEGKIEYLLFVFIFLSLTYLVASYFLERQERYEFLKALNHESNLEGFKKLICEFLPTAIVMFQNEKVIFANTKAEKIFGSPDPCFILETLQNLEFERKPYSKRFVNSLFDPYQEADYLLENEMGLSFNDLIKQQTYATHSNMLSYTATLKRKVSTDKIMIITEELEEDPIYIEVKLGRIIWDREETLLIAIEEDLKALEIQFLIKQDEFKDKILGSVSHGLKTPLNGIIGILSSIASPEVSKESKKKLKRAECSAHILHLMISDILDYSQINSQKFTLNLDLSPINELLESIQHIFKNQAKSKGLNFIIENSVGYYNIYTDIHRLKQVLFNLVSNAIKFTERGSVTVKVSSELYTSVSGKEACRNLKFEVEDTGCGINKEEIQELFKLFGKVKKGSYKNLTGVGLGLAVSQRLVSLITNNPFNRIQVTSLIGIGSKFWFYFPFDDSNIGSKDCLEATNIPSTMIKYTFRTLAKQILTISTINPIEQSSPRILIVDDDQTNILVASNYLKGSNYSYDVAINGQDALDTVIRSAEELKYYQFILMDINMPVMDGFEATEKILKLVQNSKIPNLIVIAATANASLIDQESFKRVGMSDYLSKPFTKKQLLAKLASHKNGTN